MTEPSRRRVSDADQTKSYFSGTHRARSPRDTYNTLKPLLPVFGITRVSNITGLDHVGVPVYMACRPNSRSLSVFQGKGIDADAARVSAVMEALETLHAESIDKPLKLGSFEELRFSHSMIDVLGLPLARPEGLNPFEQILWIEGNCLLSGLDQWLPYELVHANYTDPQPAGSGVFAATTNGLASGNTWNEAVLHAIYEVVERDAITLWKLGPHAWGSARAVDLATIDDPVCAGLIEQFGAAGLDVAVWDVSSDIDIACFYCLVTDRDATTGAPEMGGGAHLCSNVALARALTEAAQARTTYIAGSREDIDDKEYGDDNVVERQRMARAVIDTLRPQWHFGDAPNVVTDRFDQDLDAVKSALMAADINDIVAVDLTKQTFNIPVARVVIPGLEGAFEGPQSEYVPGLRATRVMSEDMT